MKKRLHGKKAGIVILAILLVLSMADMLLRATVFNEIAFSATNHGETIITVIFSILLIVLALKKKDRVFYLFCGVWLAYFMMNQLYGMPNMLETLVYCAKTENIFGTIAAVAHLLSIISILAIGVLLVEYMNDGTICNKAFNTLCVITVVLLGFLVLHTLHSTCNYGNTEVILAVLHELSRLTMIFLFTFFAYDSAKAQLKKTDLAK